MKTKIIYLPIILLLFVLMSGCSGTRSDKARQSITDSQASRIYEVFGMDCPGCHGGLEKLVNKIPAVQQSEANWEKQQLKIITRPDIDLDDQEIYDAIERANFTVGKRLK